MKKTVLVSDLSQTDIPEGQEAQIVITFRENGRKQGYKLDATKEEAHELGKAGKAVKFSTGRYGKNRPSQTSEALASLAQ